jgi:hypothetical protein
MRPLYYTHWIPFQYWTSLHWFQPPIFVLTVLVGELVDVLLWEFIFELLFILVLGVINVRGLNINSWFGWVWRLDWLFDI